MNDIALVWDKNVGAADFAISENDLEAEDGLETAVLLSLFTDRRADPTDTLPTDDPDLRGWWADAFPIVPGDKFGSRLWLLAREKASPALVSRAEEYVREALKWLLDDQVSDSVDVQVELIDKNTLALGISISRPSKPLASFRFGYVWAAQAARRM